MGPQPNTDTCGGRRGHRERHRLPGEPGHAPLRHGGGPEPLRRLPDLHHRLQAPHRHPARGAVTRCFRGSSRRRPSAWASVSSSCSPRSAARRASSPPDGLRGRELPDWDCIGGVRVAGCCHCAHHGRRMRDSRRRDMEACARHPRVSPTGVRPAAAPATWLRHPRGACPIRPELMQERGEVARGAVRMYARVRNRRNLQEKIDEVQNRILRCLRVRTGSAPCERQVLPDRRRRHRDGEKLRRRVRDHPGR